MSDACTPPHETYAEHCAAYVDPTAQRRRLGTEEVLDLQYKRWIILNLACVVVVMVAAFAGMPIGLVAMLWAFAVGIVIAPVAFMVR